MCTGDNVQDVCIRDEKSGIQVLAFAHEYLAFAVAEECFQEVSK